MGSAIPPKYHCIVCTLAKIPFASLSKESQQRIVRNGRPTSQMSYLRARYMNSINLDIHDWLTGCDREKKLYCWPCLLFNTSEHDVWGKRGFNNFYYLSCSRLEHTKDVSHHAKSKTLKLWIETALELSESSGEEDVECVPELDFLHAATSELDEELDVKPNVEALNTSMSLSQGLIDPPMDSSETAVGSSRSVTDMQSAALPGEDTGRDVRLDLDFMGESSRASNRSSPNTVGQCFSSLDDFARIYKKTSPESSIPTMASQTIHTGADKYQLKWHSHHQNINVSLSNLYKNDRYADVMLLTCSGEDSYTIPAHKLILGSSSLYFANIFDKSTVPMNAITYIVLPPDLTYRSMQILIQYMYTGESTVSTDILNEVLRGGEILKIRGLWRTDSAKCSGPHSDGQAAESNARFVSPVTVTIPPTSQSTSQQPHPPQQTSSTVPLIQVNRKVAIDPGERRRTLSVDGTKSRSLLATGQESTILRRQAEPSQRSEEIVSESFHHRLHHSLQAASEQQRNNADKEQSPGEVSESRIALSTSTNNSATNVVETTEESDRMPQELSFLNVKAEPVEWSDLRAGELPLPRGGGAPTSNDEGGEGEKNDAPTASVTIVKTERGIDHPGESTRSSTTPSPPPSSEQPTYSPLTCELCSETFSIPGEWVRHIEGHSETSQTLPKRRRRTEEAGGNEEMASLRCDLCATYYVTPADWVRHVQSAHTETELAASNNRALSGRKSMKSNSSSSGGGAIDASSLQEKFCDICNKSFPSYASMAIHKRTHTGEKPFHCELCNKGFNVKSNYLRHMRTLHNQQDEPLMSPQTDQDSRSSD